MSYFAFLLVCFIGLSIMLCCIELSILLGIEEPYSISFAMVAWCFFVYVIYDTYKKVDLKVFKYSIRQYFWPLIHDYEKKRGMNRDESFKYSDKIMDRLDAWIERHDIMWYRYKSTWTYDEDIWRKSTRGASSSRLAAYLFNEFNNLKDDARYNSYDCFTKVDKSKQKAIPRTKYKTYWLYIKNVIF